MPLMTKTAPSGIHRWRAFSGGRECLLRVVAISVTGRRNASHPPMGMPPVARARYCVRSWGRLPSTMPGCIVRIDSAKVQLVQMRAADECSQLHSTAPNAMQCTFRHSLRLPQIRHNHCHLAWSIVLGSAWHAAIFQLFQQLPVALYPEIEATQRTFSCLTIREVQQRKFALAISLDSKTFHFDFQ